MTDRSSQVAETGRQTARVARDMRAWIGANRGSLAGDVAVLDREFRRAARRADRLAWAAAQPMGIGVYGPSQSGKSYLISALARSADKPLMACFADQQVDFVRTLNPEGDKESTGLVTRFTVRAPDVPDPPGFPVLLRQLSEIDLIKIIGNTFFLDTDEPTVNVVDGALVRERIAAVRGAAGDGRDSQFGEDDAFDLQEYFSGRFGNFEYIKQLTVSGYWQALEAYGGRLPLDQRVSLLSLLWGDNPAFTETYRSLRDVLARTGFSPYLHAPLDALTPREQSILDVASLHGFQGEGEGEAAPVTVQVPGGRQVSIRRSLLTAVVAELHIRIADKPWSFLDHADLLDFPGARSRLDISGLSAYLAKDGALEELFLRGKVAYLFERYKETFELSAMVLCLAPGPQEVRGLPGTVADWVAATHGPRPEQRGTQRNALFLVLSKFDMVFKDKAGQSDHSDERWSTRIRTALDDFLSKSHDWPNDWDGAPFRQTYWLRNPGVQSKDLFDYDDGAREVGVRGTEQARLTRYKREYLNNALVQRHFERPDQAWEAAFRLNDGGVSYLAESLVPVCKPDMKLEQIAGRIQHTRAVMRESMTPHYDTGDTDQELERRLGRLEEAFEGLRGCIESGLFWNLVGALQISETDLRDALMRFEMGQDQEAEDENGRRRGRRGTARASMVLDRVVGRGRPAAVTPETEDLRSGNGGEPVNRVVGVTMRLWGQTMAAVMESEGRMRAFGAEEPALSVLTTELAAGAQRQNVPGQIGAAVQRAVALTQTPQRANVVAAKLASEVVNDYVYRLGFDRLPEQDRPRIYDGDHGEVAIFVPPDVDGLPDLGLSEHPGGDEERCLSEWFAALYELCKGNVLAGGSGRTPPEQNGRLGALISQLDP